MLPLKVVRLLRIENTSYVQGASKAILVIVFGFMPNAFFFFQVWPGVTDHIKSLQFLSESSRIFEIFSI